MKTIANIPIANTVYISVLAIILLIITNNINEYYDIIAADEISYLHYGKLVLKEIHTEWGFCYSLWYKLLSFFSYSTIDLYYLNYRVLMVLIPILLFILLVRYQVELPIAFALSFLFGISKLHITTWPFVSDFCILVFLIYLCIITYIKENTTKSKILLFISAILYLTRPEFIILYMHPLYKYLTSKDENGVCDAPVKWNYQKFIIDKNGKVVSAVNPRTTVNDAEFMQYIDDLIK